MSAASDTVAPVSPAAQSPAATPSVIVDSTRPRVRAALAEAWGSRTLAGFLVWRDMKVRYKQSALGVVWAVIQPVALTVVFAVFLGRFARVPRGDDPYWIMALTGLVPFTYFSQSTAAASNSLLDNVPLVSKVYFPRLLLPAAAAASTFVDACVASMVLVIATVVTGHASLFAPLAVLVPVLVWVIVVSVAIPFAATNVRYRDVRAVMPLLLQLWLFVTPVVYPLSIVPRRWHAVYGLNPMVGIVELERRVVLGEGAVWLLLPGACVTSVVLYIGIRWFLRSAAWFADVI